MNIYWLEIKRFLKENKKNILVWTLILGGALFGLFTFLGQKTTEEPIENEIEDSKKVFENDSNAAFFRFYIENSDGYSLNNPALINELFNMENMYKEVLIETGIDIPKIKKKAEEKEVIDFSPIKVIISGDSYIYTALFETGNNQNNIKLANFYYNYLFSNEISIFEDHKIFSLIEPELSKEIEEKEEKLKTSQSQTTKFNLIKTIGTNLVVSLVLSTVLAIGLSLLKALFGSKLSYIFGYDSESFDDYMVYDQHLGNANSIYYFANTPDSMKRLILSETDINKNDQNRLIDNENENTTWTHSIEMVSTSNVYDEIVILVKANETTRNWFNKQKKLISLHGAKTKLIQLNNDFTKKD